MNFSFVEIKELVELISRYDADGEFWIREKFISGTWRKVIHVDILELIPRDEFGDLDVCIDYIEYNEEKRKTFIDIV